MRIIANLPAAQLIEDHVIYELLRNVPSPSTGIVTPLLSSRYSMVSSSLGCACAPSCSQRAGEKYNAETSA